MPTPDSLTTAQHHDFDLEVTSGAWPSDIAGEVIFSAPRFDDALPSGLFGFGCVARLALRPATHGAPADRFAWRVRTIESPGKRLHDLVPDVFTANSVGYQSPFGPPNASNTAPLVWGDRLFSTWDAGRPVELDPATLDYLADVGSIDSWGGPIFGTETMLPTILSSAHPVIDPDRNGMWSTRLRPVLSPSFGMALSVMWWDGEGTEVAVWPLRDIVFGGSTHTVSQTRDWLVLSDSGNFRADPGEMFGGERTVTVEDDAPVWLVRKDQLLATPPGTPVDAICLRVAPPSGHFYARYDDSEGISVIWEGMDLTDLGLSLRPDDLDIHGRPIAPTAARLYNMAMAPSTLMEVHFDPTSGAVTERAVRRDEWAFNLQLSAMDWSVAGQEHPTYHHVDFQGCRPGAVSQRAATLYDGRIDRAQLGEETPGRLVTFRRGSLEVVSAWEYPDTAELISSPTFVPRTRSTDDRSEGGTHAGDTANHPGGHDGYVVQPVLSDSGFRVELFDAAAVGAGPIATLRGTRRECVPLILHSAWQADGAVRRDADRLRFSDEINEARLAGLDDAQRRAVQQVASDLDAQASR